MPHLEVELYLVFNAHVLQDLSSPIPLLVVSRSPLKATYLRGCPSDMPIGSWYLNCKKNLNKVEK